MQRAGHICPMHVLILPLLELSMVHSEACVQCTNMDHGTVAGP